MDLVNKYIYMCNLHFILFTSSEKRQRHEKELLNTSMEGRKQNAGQEARQRCAVCAFSEKAGISILLVTE